MPRPLASPRRVGLAAGGVLLWLPALCLAIDVRVVGIAPGRSADVVIGDGAPITIEVGETVERVRLVRADRSGAVLVVDGVTRTLPLVAHRPSGAELSGGSVTLSADAYGQFVTSGAVNGRTVRFLVDTGATLTTLSRADAERIGLDYRRGTPASAMTVNGVVNGWRVSLDAVRVGSMTVRNVEAIVVDTNALPLGLLGMSFLACCDMQRQGSTLVLRRRR